MRSAMLYVGSSCVIFFYCVFVCLVLYPLCVSINIVEHREVSVQQQDEVRARLGRHRYSSTRSTDNPLHVGVQPLQSPILPPHNVEAFFCANNIILAVSRAPSSSCVINIIVA